MNIEKYLNDIVNDVFKLSDKDNINYDNIINDTAQVLIGNMINVGRHRTAIIAKSKVAQYSAILDRKVCKLCKFLDGKYFEVGSPEYYKFTPRIHQSCRCIWVYIGDEENPPKPNFKGIPKGLEQFGSLIKEDKSSAGSFIKVPVQIKTEDVSSKEIDKKVKEVLKKITSREALSLFIYSKGKYKDINKALRNKKTDININEYIKDIDNIFNKIDPIEQNISIYRFGLTKAFKIVGNKVEEMQKLINKTFRDDGFVSAFINKNKDMGDKDLLIEIQIPKGIKILPLKNDFENNNDFLINRGTSFKIKNIVKENKYFKMICEVLDNGF